MCSSSSSSSVVVLHFDDKIVFGKLLHCHLKSFYLMTDWMHYVYVRYIRTWLMYIMLRNLISFVYFIQFEYIVCLLYNFSDCDYCLLHIHPTYHDIKFALNNITCVSCIDIDSSVKRKTNFRRLGISNFIPSIDCFISFKDMFIALYGSINLVLSSANEPF